MNNNKTVTASGDAPRELEALLDYFIDTRGCSRLTACGYAIAAIEARRAKIDRDLHA